MEKTDVTINVDTSELDKALEKIRLLSAEVDKITIAPKASDGDIIKRLDALEKRVTELENAFTLNVDRLVANINQHLLEH